MDRVGKISMLALLGTSRPWRALAMASMLASTPAMFGCGGVRVGQSAAEAEAQPAPTASEPPNQDPDAPGETSPVLTVDLERTPDAGTR